MGIFLADSRSRLCRKASPISSASTFASEAMPMRNGCGASTGSDLIWNGTKEGEKTGCIGDGTGSGCWMFHVRRGNADDWSCMQAGEPNCPGWESPVRSAGSADLFSCCALDHVQLSSGNCMHFVHTSRKGLQEECEC